MDARLHFVSEDFVYVALSLNRGLSLERFGYEDDLEMTASFSRAGMTGMGRTLVDHIELDNGGKGFAQSLLNVSSGVNGIAGVHRT